MPSDGGLVRVEGLDHRRLTPEPHAFRALRATGLYDRIGGRGAVDRIVVTFLATVREDVELRPVFPADPRQLTPAHQAFFAEWFGGPRGYSDDAHGGLVHRHDGLAITHRLAGRWLKHFEAAVDAVVSNGDDRRQIAVAARSLAQVLVTRQVAPEASARARADLRRANPDAPPGVAWCGPGARTVEQAARLARRGDTDTLMALLDEAVDLTLPTYAAAVLQAAVLAGRAATVEALLWRGFDPDRPAALPTRTVGSAFEGVLYVTPLCAARMSRRSAVEHLLVDAGAVGDVFTAAFLGDLPALESLLSDDPRLAGCADPAVDVLDVTPVDHAVAGGRPDALSALLAVGGAGSQAGAVRPLRGAAARGDAAMVAALLEYGADAARIGVGRWVLMPDLAASLASHGATVGGDGAWIGASCTGNQGRRDDPDFVRSLLRHGAAVDDRRDGPGSGVTGARAVGATALHYAARAGFPATVQVLLEHGADPAARDRDDRTPLDWLDAVTRPRAGHTAVRRHLTQGR